MSRSSKGARSGGSRLQTIGIFATLLVVAVLVGSLAAGVFQRSAPTAAAGADSTEWSSPLAPGQRVRVQVLNASGRPGLARDATRELRDRGFDVLEFGNAPSGSDPNRSVVLDRVGKLQLARQVADAIRIGRVEARPDSNLVLDVTVLLGKDWAPDTTAVR